MEQPSLSEVDTGRQSLFNARIACEKTLINGKPMQVINYDQWIKAGGQYKYPWGNQFEDVCVLESRKAFGKWKHVQPSGSMEGCVSEHGVYDQLGNAWEWVDLGRTATRDEWVDYLARQGVDVEVNQSWIEIPAQVSQERVMMEGLTIDDHRQSSRTDLSKLYHSKQGLSVV